MSLNLGAHNMRIGDFARFPLQLRKGEPPYRYRWAIHAFTRDGIVMRRLHDGIERTVSVYWFEQYRLDHDRGSMTSGISDNRSEQLATIRARRLQDARQHLQVDSAAPGFYVSARKGPQSALLIGPFVDHYSALQLIPHAWKIKNRDYDDPWCEIAIGTCRVESSKVPGKFNAEVFPC